MKKGLKVILINVVVMLMLLLVGLYILFNIYLPSYTHHGDIISVPDLSGMNKIELNEFLKQHSLRLEIADSLSYDKNVALETVISQRPKAGDMVKENRKVYVNINSKSIPEVEMPDLTQLSLFNATTLAQNNGLLLDSIKYRSSNDDGLVLAQEYNGQIIKPGVKLPKESIITLTVGRKGVSKLVGVPDLLGMPLSMVKRTIHNLGLVLGNPIWEINDSETQGFVFKQRPSSGSVIRTGEFVDIWVAGEKQE